MDIVIALLIGIIYNFLVHKIGEIMNGNLEYKDKIQRNLILTFIGGIVALILAVIVFGANKKYKNRSVRYGLYIGGSILLFYTLLYNWNVLGNDTKLSIMVASLLGLLWYSYKGPVKKSVKFDDEYDEDDEDDMNILPMAYQSYAEKFGKILPDDDIDGD